MGVQKSGRGFFFFFFFFFLLLLLLLLLIFFLFSHSFLLYIFRIGEKFSSGYSPPELFPHIITITNKEEEKKGEKKEEEGEKKEEGKEKEEDLRPIAKESFDVCYFILLL